MGTTKDIKIFKFYDIHGEKFDACLCESVEINFRENPQYSIVMPKEDLDFPGEVPTNFSLPSLLNSPNRHPTISMSNSTSNVIPGRIQDSRMSNLEG